MKNLKKLVAAATLAVTLATSTATFADSGCGYDQGRCAPCISPTVALGTIAAIAIIAVIIQNRHGSKYVGGHSHSH